jgi:TonB family protein
MNFRFSKTAALVAFLVAAVGVIACGDTTTSDESAALETSDTKDFYPFDEPPVLMKFQQPTYPQEAEKAGLEGEVAVKMLVGIDGSVERVVVLRTTDPVFEAAALEAASRCQFKPAKLEGKPTRSYVMVPFAFRLDS